MDRHSVGIVTILVASMLADSTALIVPLALVALGAWLCFAGGGADV